MSIILYEARKPEAREWRTIAQIDPKDPPGTFIDTTHGRRDVILFSCMGPTSIVTRSCDSAVEDVNRHARFVLLVRGQMETVVRLTVHGESFELDMRTAKGTSFRGRWTHYDRYVEGLTRHA